MATINEFIAEQFWNTQHSKDYPGLFQPTELARKATSFLKKHSVITVLEIGCGRSGDALYLVSEGFRVFAIDISLVALKELDKKIIIDQSVSLLQANISNGLPFRNDCVDAIYSRLSLHYFSDEVTRKVFCDIYRVLRSPGCLVMSVKSANDEKLTKRETGESDNVMRNGRPLQLFTLEYSKSLINSFIQSQVDSSKMISGENIESETIEVFAVK